MFDNQLRCDTAHMCGKFCQLILLQVPVGLAELDTELDSELDAALIPFL